MIYFPTTVIDNFLSEPQGCIDLANSDRVQWSKNENGDWPGVRSQPLHEIDNDFWVHMMNKYFCAFWPNWLMKEQGINYRATSFFQRISSDYDTGWIHVDYPDIHTTILYLTPNADPSCGTSLYDKKSFTTAIQHTDIKRKYYRGEISKEEQAPYLQEHNSGYVETVTFANKFNRLIGFDSHNYHGVKNFNTSTKEERLTLVTFIHNVVAPDLPGPRIQSLPMTRDNI